MLWADNCSSQNKNWAFITFLVQIINSDEISAETITIKYLEPGHTFMSADSFHHSVEMSLKKQKKVYDFDDFVGCVQNCNKNVKVKLMEVDDFLLFEDKSSQHKLRNSQPRVFLKDIVSVQSRRGAFDIFYKTTHKEESMKSLSFLQLKFLKTKHIPNFVRRTLPRGTTEARKKEIVEKLCPLMPANRSLFWENLYINNTSLKLVLGDEEVENANKE